MSDDLRILRLAVADDICLISRLSGIAVGVVFLPSDAVNEKRNDPWRVVLNHTFLWNAIVATLPLIAEKTQMPMYRVEQKKWRQIQRIELNLSLIGWLVVHRRATVLVALEREFWNMSHFLCTTLYLAPVSQFLKSSSIDKVARTEGTTNKRALSHTLLAILE